jgi:hypothetical protein
VFFLPIPLQAADMSGARKTNRRNRKPAAACANIVPLICKIDDALGTARAFGRAMELVALGLQDLKDDYAAAMMTVTENLLRQIENAREACAKLRSETAL